MANNNLDLRISNAMNPKVLPDPAFAEALSNLKNKVNDYCDHHLTRLRQRVARLRANDTLSLDLLHEVTGGDRQTYIGPPVPLTVGSTLNTTLHKFDLLHHTTPVLTQSIPTEFNSHNIPTKHLNRFQ